MSLSGLDSFDSILAMVVFMAACGALPTEDERRNMTRGEFVYAWFYRFLNNVCINVRAMPGVPQLGIRERKESTTSDARGNVARTASETTAVVMPESQEK